ncbi:MAG: glycoside hydrolase family 16 protein [Bacteroidales bacterium]|nr:glycoside hydrolase family 16 protein [Bacteroidales bacterium]
MIVCWFSVLAALCSCAEPARLEMFVPEGYELIWSDEFDGDSLNASFWTPEVGRGHNGWGNNELQYYTGRKENVDVRDGRLVITAQKEDYGGASVTSARLITLGKVEFLYGYVVASIKMPKTADGLWPAFWMMGSDIRTLGWPNCGETDILEMGHSNGIKAGTSEMFLNGACHWGVPGHQYYAHDITNSYSVQDDVFHTYTCIWDEEYIRMYIDLEVFPDVDPYFEMKIEDFGNDEFRKANFILLNLAVGGNFPGIWDIGGVTALADGPARMEVDYVRVFQKVK